MENKFILLSLLGITLVFLNLSNIDFWNKSTTLEKDFELWEQQFSIIQYKKISEVERLYRIKVFELNIAQINNHNSKLGKTYKLGTNQFLAITKQQFKALYLGKYEANQNYKQSLQNEQVQGLVIDWVFQKAVTTVKNQGKCQANHVFAAIGAMQGISAIFGNKLQQYSGQQIIDCSWIYGNKKCDGGQISFVYNYLQIFNNILQSQYPWTGIPGNCEAAESNKRLKSYEIVNDCANMAIALRSRPLSVVVDGQNMQFYKQGIFNNCQTNLSLPLLLVGLLDPYFTLKNSWGTTWGQNGYIRISRGNTCGVCMLASYPVPK